MVVVAGSAQFRADSMAQVKERVEQVMAASRAEAGCLSYTYWTDPSGAATLFIFEEWENGAALESHLTQPHTQEFLAFVGPLLTAPPALRRYEVNSVSSLM